MKRTAFDEHRDEQTANAVSADARLMCQAHGCPNGWSVDIGSRMCSAHYHADSSTWPQVTWDQQQAETDRAYLRQQPRQASNKPPLTREQKVEVLNRLRTILQRHSNPKAWAHRLSEREAAGEPLSLAQREMWRDALGLPMSHPAPGNLTDARYAHPADEAFA